MCNVFVKTVLTDKGKSFVHDADDTSDAQTVHKQLLTHHEKSTDAELKASNILACIMNIQWGDGHWKGTATGFVLHWMNQVYICMEMTGAKFDDAMKLTLLQNVVFPNEELHAIQDMANQLQTSTNKALTCDQHLSLVKSAAQACDGQFKVLHGAAPSSAASHARHVCAHDTDSQLLPDESACHINANTHDLQARDLADDDPMQTLDMHTRPLSMCRWGETSGISWMTTQNEFGINCQMIKRQLHSVKWCSQHPPQILCNTFIFMISNRQMLMNTQPLVAWT